MSAVSRNTRRPGDLLPFLLLSILTHFAVLAWLGRETLTLDGATEPAPIVVKLAPEVAPKAQQPVKQTPMEVPQGKQIVAPSDRENQLVPEGPAYLSDRDNRVEKETIRQGNPEAGTPGAPEVEQGSPLASKAQPAPEKAPPKPAPEPAPPRERLAAAKPPPKPAPPAKPAPKPAAPSRPSAAARAVQAEPQKPLPGLDKLLRPPAEVLAKAEPSEAAGGSPQAAAEADARRDLMSAPPPVPGILSGLRGSFDHLPDVAAGQLTMLNTKADRFAPFVRRVGTRVFQNLLIFQRRDLDVPDILAAQRLVTVRALLDPGGKLKSLEVVDRSGSPAMDRTLVEALRQAAFDPNPPAGASNADGDYEFIFQAQILASVAPGMGEARIQGVESRLRIGLM
ncbi:MAG: energy transducer TonB [Deltaproteobacteria bacterium]|nr:energy transducer TonB [Deltaproteobacteria bacterium]